MRTLLLFAGFLLAFSLTACDSTGIDAGCKYRCGDDGGHGGNGHGGDDNGGDDNGGDDGGDDGNGGGTNATIDISPFQTYLRTSDDDAIDAPAVSLTDLGYKPGDTVCFRVIGDFSLTDNYWASERGTGYLTAVFSATDHLGHDTELYRVSDAIEAGDDVFTLDTERNALRTDIDEDFSADAVCLTIPNGPEYVFCAAYDSFYGDNDNIDGTPFQVRIQK